MKRAALPLSSKSEYLKAENAVWPVLLHFIYSRAAQAVTFSSCKKCTCLVLVGILSPGWSIAGEEMGYVAENSGGKQDGKSVT